MADGQPGTVTFTVGLPADMATRSYGDGTTATTLHYAIYEQEAVAGTQGCALVKGTATFTNLKTTVTERLLPGKTYKAAFWAASENAPYTFNADAMTMTVNTASLKTNDENGDGFFGKLENISTREGAYSGNVTLRRPFAQVNVGTDDYERAAQLGIVFTDVQTSLSIADVPTVLNLFEGTTDEGTTSAEFAITAIPDGETFPKSGDYMYMAMAYVLMPKAEDKALTTVTFNTNNTGITPAEVVWNNVPVQRNYRTNIYGSLLTNPAQVNVTINPNWNRPDNEVSVWDGAVERPEVDEETGNVTVTSAAQFAGLQTLMTESNNGMKGKTITLDTDIDLNGINWTPIGQGIKNGKERFQGTFDGQGHTISNLVVMRDEREDKNYGGGMFEVLNNGAIIKNITLENPVLRSRLSENDRSGNIRGIIAGYAYVNVTFENITIKGGSNTGYGKVGGILGMAGDASGVTTFRNCVVEGMTISGSYNCGGLCGLVQNQLNVENCRVENITYVQEPGSTYLTYPEGTIITKAVSGGMVQTTATGLGWKYIPEEGITAYYAAFGKYCTYYPKQGAKWNWVGKDNTFVYDFNCDNYPEDYHWDITTPWTE